MLEATIGTFKMPAFVSGLWTSTLLFLVASVTLLGVWAGRALSSPLSAFARAAEDFSLNRSSEPLPENSRRNPIRGESAQPDSRTRYRTDER